MSRPTSYRQLFSIENVPALFIAACLSRLAGRMFTLGIILYAFARFHSPVIAGWVSFAAFTPGLVVSPIAGVLLDRIGPVRAIAVDMVMGAVFLLALVAADWLEIANIVVVLVLVSLFALTSPLGASGVRTLLPRLVPQHSLDRANALDTAIYGLVDVVGPALTGLLVGFVGSKETLALIALIYAAAALAVSRVRHSRSLIVTRLPLLRDAREGVVNVLRQPILRGLAASYSLYQVTWGILVVAVPVSARGIFPPAMADVVTGLLWTASGIAGGVGALIAGQIQTTGRERATMLFGMIVTAVAAWPIATGFGLPGLVLGLILVGLFAGPIDVGHLTLRQKNIEPGNLGRDLSIHMHLNMVGLPVGSAIGGLLVSWSLPTTFLLAGLASVIAAATARVLIPIDAQHISQPREC
jgi:MFS family permease